MTQDELKEYKKKIKNLTVNEKKMRDIHLMKIAKGEIQGPVTGYPSIDKPWLRYYKEEDLASDIPTMKAYDYLLINNNENRKKTALVFLGKKISFEELFKKVEATAKSLKQIGVKEGDIVTLSMANTPETVYLMYALNRLGAICDVIDPRLTYDEVNKELKETKSNYIFALNMTEPVMSKFNDKKVVYISPTESASIPIKAISSLNNIKSNKGETWKSFLQKGKNYCGKIDSEFKIDSPVVLVHTGGTTGFPKGVLLTNENFVSMAHMHKIGGLDYTKKDRFLNVLPPFIAYCLCDGINMPLSLGLEVVLIPLFKPKDFPKLLDQYKPNHVLSGPILWEFCLDSKISDLSYLKSPVSGGDSLNVEAERRINKFFEDKHCKVKIAQGYGMTEVSSAIGFSPNHAYAEGSVGIPFIKNSISIFNPDTLEELQYGDVGEVWLNSPTTMKEYLNNPTATNDLFCYDEAGNKWVKSGDLGRMSEDGHLYLLGRTKRMIVRSGNKIFPSSVESVIMEDNAVKNCAMVGVPDKEERTVPALYITTDSKDINTLISSIENRVSDKFPAFNIPRYYVIVDELPLTTINKIDYMELTKNGIPSDRIVDNRSIKKTLKKSI